MQRRAQPSRRRSKPTSVSAPQRPPARRRCARGSHYQAALRPAPPRRLQWRHRRQLQRTTRRRAFRSAWQAVASRTRLRCPATRVRVIASDWRSHPHLLAYLTCCGRCSVACGGRVSSRADAGGGRRDRNLCSALPEVRSSLCSQQLSMLMWFAVGQENVHSRRLLTHTTRSGADTISGECLHLHHIYLTMLIRRRC